MAIDSLVNMQQMFGSPTPDPYGITQRLQTGLGQQRAQISNNIAQDKSDKNERLGLMLYALGGALKGDQNFVQNTIKIQEMQEGKKKEKAKKAKYDDFMKKLPEGSFKDLAQAMGPDKLDQLLLERYKAETKEPKEKRIYEAADGRKYYVDTGELVFPDVEVPEKPLSETQIFAKTRNEVLERIFSTDPNVYEKFGENAEKQKALDEKYYNDIIKKPSFQETVYGNLLPQVEELKTFSNVEEAKQAGLQSGDVFRGTDGKTYKVN